MEDRSRAPGEPKSARLERQGLVERLDDPDDGRRARIRLTRRGAEVERKAGSEYMDSAARLLDGLSPEELEGIDAALGLLLDRFESPQE